MQKFFKTLLTLTILCTGFTSQAQEKQALDYKWGVEVELVQGFIPEVHIFQIQATRTLFTNPSGQKGDWVIGAYIRPNVKHDVVEEIDEYMLYNAYRHYFWKGFHAEAGINVGYAWGHKNLIDGKDYEGLSVFWEPLIGYKFDFGKEKRFYTLIQAGAILHVSADIGPRGGKTDNFPNFNLCFGVNF